MTYIGIDGCKAGWIAWFTDGDNIHIRIEPTVEAIFSSLPNFNDFPSKCYCLIDIPIGFSDAITPDRLCDKAARKILSPKGSSVFPVPCREASFADTYEQACALNLKQIGKKISKQTWFILPKVREVDVFLGSNQYTEFSEFVVRESHPEVMFAGINSMPMGFSKKSAEGQQERLAIIEKLVPQPWFASLVKSITDTPRKNALADDLIDAFILMVAAQHSDELVALPSRTDKDSTGLNREIVYWPHSRKLHSNAAILDKTSSEHEHKEATMKHSSTNKRVLITGGSRGIGAATAILLAKQGYEVVINYQNNHAAAKQVVNEIKSHGGVAYAIQADVADEQQVVDMFKWIDAHLGKVTHLVNNAGVLKPQASLLELDAARINHILATNVTSCLICSREAVKRMTSGGAIVNVSSGAANTGSPFEYVDYAASKGAMDSITKGLSIELAERNIRVNSVRPGCIYTDMHADGGEPNRVDRLANVLPLKRGGQPEEVAEAIAWLLSDKSSFSTGAFINVTGGK